MTWRLTKGQLELECEAGCATVWSTTAEACDSRYAWIATRVEDLSEMQGWSPTITAAKAAAETWLA